MQIVRDEFGRYDGCQTSDLAVVANGAEILRMSEEANVECGALRHQHEETLVEDGAQVLPECDKVGNIGCRIGCGYRAFRVLPHASIHILQCAD